MIFGKKKSIEGFFPLLLILLHVSFFLKFAVSLRPQTSETREVNNLDGLWNFHYSNRTNPDDGFLNHWYQQSLKRLKGAVLMPVPSSYNDITQDKALRDYVGWVWYDREFYVGSGWKDRRIVLRFESVHYFAQVWLNGKDAMIHEGGHLPFENEVTELLDFSGPNRITVAVNNTLTPFTLPCGHIVYPQDPNNYPTGYFRQELIFDFFNYAGIHRSVLLYATSSSIYVADIVITTNYSDVGQGVIQYDVKYPANLSNSVVCHIEISDVDNSLIATETSCLQTTKILNPRLWWPVGMNDQVGHLYVMKITLSVDDKIEDVYRQKFGIRTVQANAQGIHINGKPFYFLGFGKHEDFHIFGRGFNLPLMVKDFNLIQWIGGNSFRTSHYPYAEEVLDYADEHGIVIIDEAPAVGLHEFPNKTLLHHLRVLEELVNRDRNHPSVIMWSVANEPKSYDPKSEGYFRKVIEHTKDLDQTRPVTFVIGGSNATRDRAAQFVDILCVNDYFGWYSDPGHTELIQRQLLYNIRQWHHQFKKSVIVTEYGADTVAGIHTNPSFVFSEEYQIEFMTEYHKAFDQLRNEGILSGELIWNFADFMTDQQINRIWGNRKGIFTRERQPKMSAHFLRKRYRQLANLTNAEFSRKIEEKEFLRFFSLEIQQIEAIQI